MKLLIIADDFTGALDTGVQLSKCQIPTCVYANAKQLSKPSPDCEALVINANMRHAAPNIAYEQTERILRFFDQTDLHIYLKTDSVLRGNISAVFAAAMRYLKKPLCFIPAFPALKRTTKDAAAYVDNQRLEQSVFRNDPRTPTLESDIPTIINRDYPMRCISVKPEDLASFHADQSDAVYLFDCETDAQMQTIGQTISERSLYSLTAGCAGFAATFVEHIAFEKKEMPKIKNNKPALFVSGSANAVTFRQLCYAKQHKYPIISLSEQLNNYIQTNLQTLSIHNVRDLSSQRFFQSAIKEAAAYLQAGQAVVLTTAADQNELLDLSALKKLNEKKEETIHNFIAEYTSTLVKSIIDISNPGNLVVFGGDMAAAILEKCGYEQMMAAGEIAAGVPVSRICDKDGQSLNLVTKSGGFGDENIIDLIHCYFYSES